MDMIEWGPSYPEQPEWQGEVGGGIWDREWTGMDRIDGIDLIDLIDRMVSCEGAAQSVALGWYGAFLQNAEVGVVGYPERCSGLVCGVPLGHGVGWFPR
jgi:hypothetical protein